MGKLYILGNGFDLLHNLPTSYDNFKSFLEKSNKEDRDLIQKLEDIYEPGQLWKEFEIALGKPKMENVNQIENLFNLTIFDEQFKSKVSAAFEKWIRSIDKEIYTKAIKYTFSPEDKFISFNYTPTLEFLYNINLDQILHIHGFVVETFFGENLLIGHGKVLDNSEHQILKVFKKDVGANIKNKEKEIQHLIKDCDEIVVIGFSYSEVDFPYFKHIAERKRGIRWEFRYHTPKDLEDAKGYKNKLNLDDKCVTFSRN